MNTATGTRKDKLSDDERANRRRGMKLVSRNSGSPLRIALCQDLVDSFRDSDNETIILKPSFRPVGDEVNKKIDENAFPGDAAEGGSIRIAFTLTAVLLTGVMVGLLLGRDRSL